MEKKVIIWFFGGMGTYATIHLFQQYDPLLLGLRKIKKENLE